MSYMCLVLLLGGTGELSNIMILGTVSSRIGGKKLVHNALLHAKIWHEYGDFEEGLVRNYGKEKGRS